MPHLGQSDHLFILLIPAYIPLMKIAQTATKALKHGLRKHPCSFRIALKGNFFCGLELVYASNVLCLKKCVDKVTVSKHICVYPNQKTLMTKEIRSLLKHSNTAFRSGKKTLYSMPGANLIRAIREAKEGSKNKIEDHFTYSDPQ